MADIRINALATTATTPASDDYLALDGAAQGTRKILATNIANNVTDVILGASGPSVKSTLSAHAPRQGLVFDGSSTSVGTVSIPAYGQSALTISGWAVWTGAQQGVILDGTNSIVAYVNGAGSFRIYSRPASADLVTTADGTIVANKWFHWAYNRDKIYINGVAASASAGDTQNYTGGTTSIGQNVFSADRWIGAISGPFIYNRALSASEVVALYEAGAPSANDIPGTAAGTAIGNQAAANTSGLTSFSSSSGQFSGTTNSTGSFYVRFSTGRINTGNVFRVTGTVSYGGAYPSYGGITQQGSATGGAALPITNGNFDVVITAHSYQATGLIDFYIGGVNGVSWTVNNITITPLGLLLAPDAAQAGGGLVWYDTSGNAANISWTSGVSWNVPTSGKMAGNLTVNGGQIQMGGTNPYIQGTTGTGYIQFQNGGDVILASNSGRVVFGSNGVTNATLFTTGNFLVGTGSSDTGQKLQVSGNARLTSYLEISGGTGANTTVTRIVPSGWNGLTHRYGVQSSGDTTQFSANAAMTAATTGNLDDTAVGAGVLNLSGASLQYAIATAGTNPRTFSSAFNVDYSGNATFAGNLTVSGVQNVIGSASPSANFPLRINQGATNATVTMDIANVSSGTAAAANIQLQTDAGTSFLRQHSAAHSVWPNYLLLGGSDNIAISTGSTSDGIELMTGFTTRVNITTATTTIANTLAINNTVQTAASVASTHKVTISIGGSTYYLLATNV